MESPGNEVTKLAYIIAEEISVMPDLALADIMYYPQYYYKDYLRSGGNKSLNEWTLLCERERKPMKNRKSLR